MSPLRTAQILTIGLLLMAFSSAAQNTTGTLSVSSGQEAVANADSLLNQAAQYLEEANQPTNEYAWSDLAVAAARANDVTLAIRAAGKSHKDSDSMAKVAAVLMKQGKKNEAYGVIGLLAGGDPPVTPELIAYESLIESQVAARDVAGAKETLERMEKLAGPEPDNIYLVDAQKKLEKAQETGNRKMDFVAALDSAKKIPDAGERGQTLIVIGVLQLESGDGAGAAETLRLGEQALSQSKDKSAKNSGLMILAKAEARLGNIKKALEIAKSLPNNDANLLGLNSGELAVEQIAFEQARAGDAAGAFETVQRLKLEHSRLEILEAIAKWQLRNHDNAAALRTCQKIAELPGKADFRKSYKFLGALLRAAEIENEAGDGQLAQKTITRVMQEAAGFKDGEDRSRLITDIAEAQAKSGDFEGARKELEQLPQSDPLRRMEVGTLIAKAQAENKQFAGAQETMASAAVKCSKASSLPLSCGFASDAFPDVLRALARSGNEEGALNWANGRSAPADKAKALVGVAQGLLDRVSPDETMATSGLATDDLKVWETF